MERKKQEKRDEKKEKRVNDHAVTKDCIISISPNHIFNTYSYILCTKSNHFTSVLYTSPIYSVQHLLSYYHITPLISFLIYSSTTQSDPVVHLVYPALSVVSSFALVHRLLP